MYAVIIKSGSLEYIADLFDSFADAESEAMEQASFIQNREVVIVDRVSGKTVGQWQRIAA